MTVLAPQIEVAIARVRDDVAALHAELVRNGLVVWTGGNVSGRVPGTDLFVIKPSGVEYDQLGPENMMLCDADGNVVRDTPGWEAKPSTDTAAHAVIYRRMPEVGGIVHTHSTYATAWAAAGVPIPCVLTAMADEFGGDVPVVDPASVDEQAIGRAIADTLAGHRSRAVLVQGRGPFAIGVDARDAVKAAVMVEDAARTVHLARQLGSPSPIPQDQVDALYERYQNAYGQTPQGELRTATR